MSNQNREQQLYHEVMRPAVNDLLEGFDNEGNHVPGLKELASSEKLNKRAALKAYTTALEQATTPQDIYHLLTPTPQSEGNKNKGFTYVVQTYLVDDSSLAKKARITRVDYESSEEAKMRHDREQLENLPKPDENLAVIINHLIDRITAHDEMQSDRTYLVGKKRDTLAAHEARRLLTQLKRKFPSDYNSHHGELTYLQQILDKPKRNTPNQLEHIYQLARNARPVYLLAIDEYIDIIEKGENTDLKLIPILAPLLGDAHATLDEIKKELLSIQAQHGNLRQMGKTLDDILTVVEGASTSPKAIEELKQKVTYIRTELNAIFLHLGKQTQPETNYPLKDIIAYAPLLATAAIELKTTHDDAQLQIGRLNTAAGLTATQHADEIAKLSGKISDKDQTIGETKAKLDRTKADNDDLEQENRAFDDAAERQQAALERLGREIAVKDAELARRADYDPIKTERDQRVGENTQLQHAKAASETALTAARDETAAQQAKAQAAETAAARAQGVLAAYQTTEQSRIDVARAPLLVENATLEGRVNQLNQVIIIKDAELTRRSDYDSIKAELGQKQTEHQALAAERAAQQARADAAEADAQRKQTHIDGEQVRIDQAKAPIEAERDQARADKAQLETRVANLTDLITRANAFSKECSEKYEIELRKPKAP